MSSMDKLLLCLPSSVSAAYEKILSESSDKESAKTLLQIVIIARRPLTLEANIALSIATQGESCKSHQTLELQPSAVTKGNEQIVEMLLHQNADINAGSESRGTAIMTAAATVHGKICEMLLNENADVNAITGDPGTALMVAADK